MRKSENSNSKKDYSTREMIISRSTETINSIGMVDFRIDTLSEELMLSPGNITYHFSKKEELLNTLWIEFCHKFDSLDILLTKIIDVKQFFLFLKSTTGIIYRYRGIVMFRGGDIKYMSIDKNDHESFNYIIGNKLDRIIERLAINGFFDKEYVERDGDIIKKIVLNALIHWINREILLGNKKNLAEHINKNALLSLYAFHSMFTVKGKMQYEEIKKMIDSNNIDFQMQSE